MGLYPGVALSNSCHNTPEQRVFLLKYQLSQVAWLSHRFAISLSHRQTSFQARYKCLFQRQVCTSASPTTHREHELKVLLHMQAHQSCALHWGFWPDKSKNLPHCKHRVFMQVQRASVSVHKCQAPPQTPICTPIHAPTVES